MAIKIAGTSVIDNSKSIVNPNKIYFNPTFQTLPAGVNQSVPSSVLLSIIDNPNSYDTSQYDLFGHSVAISGKYAIVGAYQEEDAGGAFSGKAYIFEVTTGQLLWRLNNPNAYSTSASDYFGSPVAISDNYAIVGAFQEDDAGGFSSGKAYIFNVTTSALVWTLNNPNAYSTGSNDYFGFSVGISGNYAIVGAYNESDAGGAGSGKAYIFNVTTGQLVWTLNNPNAYSSSGYDYFGYSAAIDGNYAIVGAYGEDDAGGAMSGKAYIFNVTTGQLVWTLDNPNAYDTSDYDWFGTRVAISGNYAIVGSSEDDAVGESSGKAYIFDVTTGQLLWTLNNPNAYGTGEYDRFGESVSISGNYAIVGAYEEDDPPYEYSSGKAYIFNVTTGQLLWTLDNPTAYSTGNADNFGWAVAISGNYAIVGARGESEAGAGSASGKAYIYVTNQYNQVYEQYTSVIASVNDYDYGATRKYVRGTKLWTLNNPNAYSTSAYDIFGYSVAISGNYAIVGAVNEDDAGGINSGKAYIYNVTTGALVWTLNNPNAYSTSDSDYFGWSVAVDGNYAIVSAYLEDDASGFNSGKAYIYSVTTGALVWTLNNPNLYSTSLNDFFGTSVAISGNYAIVGAYGEDDTGGNDSGKAYVYNVTTGALIWTLNNPNPYGTSASDNFGQSVAISGNYAIVGAVGEDDASGTFSGKAYIYNVTTGALVWTLNNPNPYSTSLYDYFGSSVAISGNYAIVGACFEDDASGTDSGKAYIYNVTTGALLWTLNNPNPYSTSQNDNFGVSVAISGNYAIVGAYQEEDAGGTDSGKAYIYNVTTGQLLWTLNNPNAYSTSFGDYFGNSVAISGNYAIVGVYYEDDAGGNQSGKAYIFAVNDVYALNNVDSVKLANGFTLDGGGKLLQPSVPAGALLKTFDNPNAYSTSANDNFGVSVAIDGNYAIVGAYWEDNISGSDSGKAYIFNVTTGALLFTLNNPNAYSTGANDYFGYSVAVSGNYAIIGARTESDASGTSSGKAYIYNVTTGQLIWTLDNPNAYSTGQSDNFGYSMAISGNYAIIGAVYEDDSSGTQSGKAYIFNVTTGALLWTLTNPNAYSTSSGDWFGNSVAVSGNYAIVSAVQEEDAGGSYSGKAYIYNVTTGALVWTLNDPNAYSTSTGDRFGYSVAISGNYAIVGAADEGDTGGAYSGKAYIYNVTTGELLYTLNNPNAYGTRANDGFGVSAAISGNYAIVGATGEDDAGGNGSGKAYIFNVTTGALVWTLDNPNAYDTSTADMFGGLIGMSGDYAIISAYAEDDAGGTTSGKAYLFSVRDLTYLDRLVQMVS
jgi:outer membrane protein assembly factor BamB